MNATYHKHQWHNETNIIESAAHPPATPLGIQSISIVVIICFIVTFVAIGITLWGYRKQLKDKVKEEDYLNFHVGSADILGLVEKANDRDRLVASRKSIESGSIVVNTEVAESSQTRTPRKKRHKSKSIKKIRVEEPASTKPFENFFTDMKMHKHNFNIQNASRSEEGSVTNERQGKNFSHGKHTIYRSDVTVNSNAICPYSVCDKSVTSKESEKVYAALLRQMEYSNLLDIVHQPSYIQDAKSRRSRSLMAKSKTLKNQKHRRNFIIRCQNKSLSSEKSCKTKPGSHHNTNHNIDKKKTTKKKEYIINNEQYM